MTMSAALAVIGGAEKNAVMCFRMKLALGL
jgi:hypothetical protein